MSAVDVSAPAVRRTPRFSTRFFTSELRLIFGRRRNQAGLLVLAAVPVVVAVAVKLASPDSNGGEGPDFFSSITQNGLFVALAALNLELGLFLPLAVATISGDTVAGEANLGTLRYLLTVPVHRTRLLAVKYAAICLFALLATLLVSVVGVVMGLALFGGGDLTLLSGNQVSFGDGMVRVALSTLYLAIGLASLGAVGLFVSTLTEQPIGATIAVVIFTVASFIMDSISQLSWLHPYLITHYWLDFGDFLRSPVEWTNVQHGVFLSAVYAVVFWLAAWARFSTKDVTS